MKIGILGTGMVGSTIGKKLIENGHEVMMGSRTAGNEKAIFWVNACGKNASEGTFADAASFGELLFNCTTGVGSLSALELAGSENLKGKILIDVSNPLDFSKGFPPTLTIVNTDSLAELLQRTFPETKVVKTLNTTNCNVMVDPSLVPGEHDLFMSGNDADAKQEVTSFLQKEFGWKNIIDLGDISTARGTEQLLPLWVRLYSTLGHGNFNFHVVK